MFLHTRSASDAPTPPVRDWDPAITIPTLIGSLLSFCATTSVIICWLFFGGSRRREFRYALILNLAFAEFINTLNNSVSGLVVTSTQANLHDGAACAFNGWLGQASVQAVDFSILAISVVTLLTIQLKSYVIYASKVTKTLICVSVWIVPLTTSILGWRWNLYEPVTGNWCWIGSRHETLRYALTHGWRYGIIIISFCIYIFVFAYMHRRLKRRIYFNASYSSYGDIPYQFSEVPAGVRNSMTFEDGQLDILKTRNQASQAGTRLATEAALPPRRYRRGTSRFSFTAPGRNPPLITPIASDFQKTSIADNMKGLDENTSSFRLRRTTTKVDRDIWQMVLLNLYPVTYLILWLPGLANRIAEAYNHNVRALFIMQCSTQYIGLANACVYMYKEHRKDVKTWLGRMKRISSEDYR